PFPAGAGQPEYWNMPVRSSWFVGRDGMLADLRCAFVGGRGVVAALHGDAGVGKTQLAVEDAYRYAARYRLVWFISAGSEAEVAESVRGLAAALDISKIGQFDGQGGPGATATELADELDRLGDWLMIFDDADEPQYVKRYFPGDGGHILITSR